MMLLTIILALCIILILMSITNALISISLRLVTKEKFEERTIIIPSLLSLIIWFLAFLGTFEYISYKTGTSITDTMFASMFNASDFNKYLPEILLPIIAIVTATLFLQSIALLAVNINYKILFNKFRFHAKDKIKRAKRKFIYDNGSELICNTNRTDMQIVEEKYKLTLINSFVCNLFIFSLLFFLYILFFWLGTLIGNKII